MKNNPFEISIDKTSALPLYRQISHALTTAMAMLPHATKLPTIRSLAQSLEVNNMTVVNAYKHLENSGAVYSVIGSGFYVAEKAAKKQETIISDCINFADTTTDPAFFPVDAFRKACDHVLLRDGGMAFNESLPQGYAPLQKTISEQFVNTSPQNIQIIADISSAMEQFVEKFINPGDIVFVERPGLESTMFSSKKARVIEVSRTANGLQKLESLMKQHKPKYLFLMPNFQIPTGLCYTKQDLQHIIHLSLLNDTYIIEVDSLSDFYYGSHAPVSMKSLDMHDRVIYIKCFARMLASGLRIGYIAYPKVLCPLEEPLDAAPSGFIQRVFDFYLSHIGFLEHAALMRVQYGKRYRKLIQACQTYLSPYAHFTEPNGGLGLWINPKMVCNVEIFEKFLHRKVVVSPGHMFVSGKTSQFRINFSNIPEERIAEGIGIISSVLAKG